MSENAAKCLHCGTEQADEYHNIFDDIGTELQLDKLLRKHFQILVRQNAYERQVLCDVCVNRLVELFDIEQLKKEKDDTDPEPEEDGALYKVKTSGQNSKEKSDSSISVTALINDVLADNEYIAENANEHNYVAYEQGNTVVITAKYDEGSGVIIPGTEIPYEQVESYNENGEIEATEQFNNIGVDNEIDVEIVDSSALSDKEPRSIESNDDETMTEDHIDESASVLPDVLEPIPDEIEFVNLDDYLNSAIRSKFETFKFKLESQCSICSQHFITFEDLFDHMKQEHNYANKEYTCTLSNCMVTLSSEDLLARHIVLKHCDLNDMQIYGSCPDCDFRYSNFLHFNKHSCCRKVKRRRGMRLSCDMCNIEFPSFKRYIFHMQFHIDKCRPRICFICDHGFIDVEDLFEHVSYAHEPTDSLACIYCDRNFKEKHVFEEHKRSHNQDATVECSVCLKKFGNKNLLFHHMNRNHPTPANELSCDYCDKVFPNEAALRKHMKTHDAEVEEQMSVCTNCNMISIEHETLLEHTQDVESNCYGVAIALEVVMVAFSCEYCSMDYKSKNDLKAHRATGIHSDGNFMCIPCKKTFKTFKLLRGHTKHKLSNKLEQKINIPRLYMCNFGECEETYAQWNSLYIHKKRTHSENSKANRLARSEKNDEDEKNAFTCQFCGKGCPTKMSLSVHVARRHNNNNVICSYCDASYKTEEILQKHIDFMHIPIKCDLCHKVVKNRRNFKTHEIVVHSNEKRYFCEVCAKGFYHKSDRDAHAMVHQAKYYCGECSFSTSYANSLEIHIASIHKKERQFQCRICDKEFGRKHALMIHIKRHDAQREFICSDRIPNGCKKSFVTSYLLNKHIRDRHAQMYDDDEPQPKAKRSRKSKKAIKLEVEGMDTEDEEYLEEDEIPIEQLIEEEDFGDDDVVEIDDEINPKVENEVDEEEFTYVVYEEAQ